jgi:hypothetical protein
MQKLYFQFKTKDGQIHIRKTHYDRILKAFKNQLEWIEPMKGNKNILMLNRKG